ncbi:2-phosphosulfolactate phosphatase [Marinithermus hydrothermalis]|uniref:Probable 2-phosphosulfolactate phosphatase n=1 Tax=Marinithermus hydrothermalis (strain DSM 14884 / JCM 11576 / T1) TaxID=869210 RepID=F2NQD7_MARHT|nr:2-phosphosulfolactate phosphatase [Marinithermus hydrothermalis]AEB11664.1 2-phosphosulfolactate phosphatase [Marinithermus hydrothermalis DSM 14884]
MRLRVELAPRAEMTFPDVVIVVDVIRATTTAVAFLEAGARTVHFTASPEAARAFRTRGALVAGEVGGLPPEGFDLGNSPREALAAPVRGREVAMSTTNGTRAAILAAQTARHVLLGSLYNAPAAARLARALAREEVAVLCAGKEGQPGLDDTYTAGVIAELLRAEGPLSPNDGAWIAFATREAYPTPLEALRRSAAAAALERVGLEADVPFCAQIGGSALVPVLKGQALDALAFVPYA